MVLKVYTGLFAKQEALRFLSSHTNAFRCADSPTGSMPILSKAYWALAKPVTRSLEFSSSLPTVTDTGIYVPTTRSSSKPTSVVTAGAVKGQSVMGASLLIDGVAGAAGALTLPP
jgi:hypothetical protein